MHRICPKCGATSEKKRFVKNFCEDCFSESVDIHIPPQIELIHCKVCGNLKLEHWKPMNNKNVERVIHRSIKTRHKNMRFILPNGYAGTAYVVVLVPVGEEFVEVTRTFETRLKPEICEECSRKSSGYFEAIVQVRGDDPDKIARAMKKLERAFNRRTFIAKEVPAHSGYDIYVGSNSEARSILSMFGYSFKISSTLYGVKDGQRVYRITYCIRV